MSVFNASIVALSIKRKSIFESVLSDSATPSNLNASNFLTVKDNIMLNPIF